MNNGLLMFSLSCAVLFAQGDPASTKQAGIADCAYQANPDQFLTGVNKIRQAVFKQSARFNRLSASRMKTMAASEIPRRNFIDDEIFNTMGDVPSAPLATDEEFVRRIYLDLTGRLPSPDDIRNFLAQSNEDKRSQLIDQLMYSPEFDDRWTMWLGDLVQNNASASNVNRQIQGRNAFDAYLRQAMSERKSLRDIAIDAVSASGNNYDAETGAAGFAAGSITPMGPVQDRYDTMLVRTATAWLGMAHYDCLLCHSGRRHLDQLSYWGANATRQDAWKMAAFFSRLRLQRNGDRSSPYYQSYAVSDAVTGAYQLNTDSGNRPPRTGGGNVTPEYHFTGAQPADGNWRAAFAENLVEDRMFARNLANRLWKQMFGLGLVDPVDQLDPLRLDPNNPPPCPDPQGVCWALQATHPALLEMLADELIALDFDLREFLRVLADSSAYQLSSRYDGDWQYDYIALFARHFPRRLEGEEVVDAIAAATGVPGNYTVQGWSGPVQWAVQLPDPSEPRGNGAVNASARNFMNTFFRGNRDDQQRKQPGSLVQQLNLMNETRVVLDRIRIANSPNLQVVAQSATETEAVEQLFLLFLSRFPNEREMNVAVDYLDNANGAWEEKIEDLAWACIMKIDFEFSY
jgi:hypothetical protein